MGIFFLFSHPVYADCLDLGDFTGWTLVDSHTIIFYRGLRPIAQISLPNCQISNDSVVRLSQSYVCDSDNLIINNEPCNILSVKVLY